ncbi:MAG: GNAT family N-acetyltransferase [Pseudomonas sp.]|uniref:GNAT family N-acetyltransferase n=1 Tax=Pseudomonas abieticivorans TaxID=2931382 RepID=UPI0020BD8680|nr:GNAT family N-acetyltransferase [Pseudomonas sp. PIA16]MDE1163869.1 GNAT family N-acetyltransferase [Pseudomonas sp.]
MSTVNPALAVRVADEGFEAYVLGCEFGFRVEAYGQPQIGKKVAQWALAPVSPYRKCYGIDPEEFRSYRNAPDSAVFMAYLGERAVGHVVVSTNWNGLAHVDELAVDASARRSGVARALLDVVRFWAQKKSLPGIMLETQNNNLAACRLYERYGFELGGIDHLRYRGIDPETAEVAVFWYLFF